jgi:glycosyltransferase involved in cell wall biosynthesis/GT2 family glycosyltransferase
MPATSVVIPVKDGARWLEEVLRAVAAEGPDEVLVIDSGSTDGSLEIARAAGVRLVEIAPAEFGHGRTRDRAIDLTSGEIVCFITQDATPVRGWLAAYVEAFALDPKVGAAFGPHLPRPDTSPMIARELTEFFAGFSPDGGPAIQRSAGEESWHPGFLSNANAAYRRAALEEVRFRDLPYAEDQAFARDLFAAGWWKAYHPKAAVLHAHDYPWGEFMRRYFDEYRGLRETLGHVEGFGVRSTGRLVAGQVGRDRAWLREQGAGGAELAAWSARSAAHHGGRAVFSALGSRADRLPPAARRALSLERRADGTGAGGAAPADPGAPKLPALTERPPMRRRELFDDVAHLARAGAAPLLEPVPGMADKERLHVAIVIPPFRIGSGGHNSIFQIALGLEAMGHSVSIWLDDPLGWQKEEWPAVVRDTIREYFAPLEAPVYKDFERDWFGADVVVATGWQTVRQVMLLPNCRARAYLVHDHENEFYATSVEARWAEETYGMGLFHICSSPWLADLVEQRYGGRASLFQFGVDHEIYHPRPIERRGDTVLFYARHVTPRRAVPLGVLALAALKHRRPDVRIVMFGDHPMDTTFAFEHVGVATQEELSWLYGQGTVGLVLSMTNYSLVPQEMMACGLPVVDLAGFSAETVFGDDGPIELAGFDADEIAAAIERLLDDPALWERRSRAGIEFVREHTWPRAAAEVEAGLRAALREREPAAR